VLDKHSRDIVLENLKRAATATQWPTLVAELQDLGDLSLDAWAPRSGRRISDLYRVPGRSWTRLRRDAGLPTATAQADEERLLRAVRRLDHIDDPERTAFYRDVLGRPDVPDLAGLGVRQQRMLTMVLNGLGVHGVSLAEACRVLWPHVAVRAVLVQLFEALDARGARAEVALDAAGPTPIALHAQYTRTEALLAVGDGSIDRPPTSREGVRWVPDARTDVLFVTLRKSERSFSPSTMYRDYALSRELFHWESQNATHDQSETGKRYQEHRQRGSQVLLFVRETELRPNGAGAPFTCLGPVTYVSHVENRPMRVTWRLEQPLPEALFEVSQLLAAA
jgi:hypothetical protein